MSILDRIKSLFNKLFNNKKMLPENSSNLAINENKITESKEIVVKKYQDKIDKVKELKEENERLDKIINEKSKVLYSILNDIENISEDVV